MFEMHDNPAEVKTAPVISCSELCFSRMERGWCTTGGWSSCLSLSQPKPTTSICPSGAGTAAPSSLQLFLPSVLDASRSSQSLLYVNQSFFFTSPVARSVGKSCGHRVASRQDCRR